MGSVINLRASSEKVVRPEAPTKFDHSKRDAELVEKALEGNRFAQNELVRLYAREITRVVSRLLGSQDEVEDLVQDAFFDALKQLDRLKEPSSFRGWLMRIAINKTRMAIRKRKMLRAFGLDRSTDDATLEHIANSDVSPEVRVELAEIDRVLEKIPANQRIIWILRHVEGHTLRDISRLCQCSLATTKRRLVAAHRKVLESIDEEVLNHGS